MEKMQLQLKFDATVITQENYKDWINTINRMSSHIAHLVYRRGIGMLLETLDDTERIELLKLVLSKTTTMHRKDRT